MLLPGSTSFFVVNGLEEKKTMESSLKKLSKDDSREYGCLSVIVTLGDRSFPFEVFHRPLQISDNLWIHSYGVDLRALRLGKKFSMWRTMVDLFWEATLRANLDEAQFHEATEIRMLAELFPIMPLRMGMRYFQDGSPFKPSGKKDRAKRRQEGYVQDAIDWEIAG